MDEQRGRLNDELLDRYVEYGHRILQLAQRLDKDRRPRRLVDQITGSGTSAGANTYEAHESVSRRDFVKCLGITAKELNETIFWIRLIQREEYLPENQLAGLLQETEELLAITKSMIRRTRQNDKK